MKIPVECSVVTVNHFTWDAQKVFVVLPDVFCVCNFSIFSLEVSLGVFLCLEVSLGGSLP